MDDHAIMHACGGYVAGDPNAMHTAGMVLPACKLSHMASHSVNDHISMHPQPLTMPPAPTHNDVKLPMPGIEPVPEPTFIDRAQHDDIVALAIWQGYEAGRKEGRNSGFRKGLAANTKAGWSMHRKEGSSEGTKQGSPEASTPALLAMSIDEIDTDLLMCICKEAEYGVWEEGLEAGMMMGRKEGREGGYREGYEAARCETDDGPVRTYVDIAIRTSPTACTNAAMQTLLLYVAAMPFIEDPDPALLDPTHLKEIVVMALHDGHAVGLKEGRHVGLHEGVKIGHEHTRAEACCITHTSCQVQTDDLPTPVHIHAAVLPAPFFTTT
ncbi:hypothetical protein EWM64_g8177 [Hericium alpestre]|uniref:Essential protein Yae1 N-terminal domain-containing protein n=1 Tax=Hericium alpestre TaxID=135208 RepID=A0A4Y9ZLV5_9AGAM|nr:hypothetical protein EWM64_g8177 [Hericium alpestre]